MLTALLAITSTVITTTRNLEQHHHSPFATCPSSSTIVTTLQTTQHSTASQSTASSIPDPIPVDPHLVVISTLPPPPTPRRSFRNQAERPRCTWTDSRNAATPCRVSTALTSCHLNLLPAHRQAQASLAMLHLGLLQPSSRWNTQTDPLTFVGRLFQQQQRMSSAKLMGKHRRLALLPQRRAPPRRKMPSNPS